MEQKETIMMLPKEFLKGTRLLRVDWAEHAWTPRILGSADFSPLKREMAGCGIRSLKRTKVRAPMDRGIFLNQAPSPTSIRFPMRSLKTKTKPMNRTFSMRTQRGFTLIELLVVISIIAILAGLLLPALARAKITAKVGRAKTEMNNIVAAINQYETAYSRLPISTQAAAAAAVNGAAANGNGDFTFGTQWTSNSATIPLTINSKAGGLGAVGTQIGTTGSYVAANNDIMAILLDLDKFPDGTATSNAGHAKNPQRTPFLNAKLTGDTTSPGVGNDYVYRDPFGNPYIITLDANYDGKTQDTFYCQQSVSQPTPGSAAGINGLANSVDTGGNGNHFMVNGPVMVWSLGPDGAALTTVKANAGVNKDNVTSW